MAQMMLDAHQLIDEMALALLKEQEAVKPIEPTISDHPWWRCGNCGGDIGTEMHRFCPWCGRKVKWDETD